MNFSKLFLYTILNSFLIYGCTNSQKKEETYEWAQTALETAPKPESDSVIYSSKTDTIRINIQNGKGYLKIHKEERDYVNLVFNSEDFTKMTTTLSAQDSTANIRFSQIVMPNGDMDGPFGATISYHLPIQGDYLLLIHENQMAGDPWSGDFEINISLSK